MASKLKEESYNRQKAEETISSLQSKISLFELDLKHKQEEVATVQARNKEIEAKLEVETRRRQDHEQSLKRLEEEYKTKLSQREHELKSQMNEMKTEKQKMQHAIYRLERWVGFYYNSFIQFVISSYFHYQTARPNSVTRA